LDFILVTYFELESSIMEIFISLLHFALISIIQSSKVIKLKCSQQLDRADCKHAQHLCGGRPLKGRGDLSKLLCGWAIGFGVPGESVPSWGSEHYTDTKSLIYYKLVSFWTALGCKSNRLWNFSQDLKPMSYRR